MNKGRTIIILSVIVMCITIMGGCMHSKASDVDSKNNNSSESLEKNEYVKMTNSMLQCLKNNDREGFLEYIDDSAKKDYSEQDIELKSKYLYDFGSVSNIDVRVRDDSDYYTVSFIIKGANRSSIVTNLFYEHNNKVFLFSIEDYIAPLTDNEVLEEKQVVFGEYKLDGVLTLPKNVKNPPVVVLVNGSGQHNADSQVYSNKPFKDIAHGLAKQGIASLRYCDRYYKYIDLDNKEITIDKEVIDDAVDAVKYLENSDLVDSKNIFYIGHSLGGCVLPKVVQRCPNLAGSVSMAGTTRKYTVILEEQSINSILADDTLDEDAKQAQIQSVKEQLAPLHNITSDGDVFYYGYFQTYLNSVNNMYTEEDVKNIDIPLLIMQGTGDLQVSVENDYELWKKILEGKPNCSFKLYDGLNHMFMKTKGANIITIMQEYAIQDNVDSQVIEDLGTFVKDNVN